MSTLIPPIHFNGVTNITKTEPVSTLAVMVSPSLVKRPVHMIYKVMGSISWCKVGCCMFVIGLRLLEQEFKLYVHDIYMKFLSIIFIILKIQTS